MLSFPLEVTLTDLPIKGFKVYFGSKAGACSLSFLELKISGHCKCHIY